MKTGMNLRVPQIRGISRLVAEQLPSEEELWSAQLVSLLVVLFLCNKEALEPPGTIYALSYDTLAYSNCR
jgi:hypothetical protein